MIQSSLTERESCSMSSWPMAGSGICSKHHPSSCQQWVLDSPDSFPYSSSTVRVPRPVEGRGRDSETARERERGR